jgi:hypothetical protein
LVGQATIERPEGERRRRDRHARVQAGQQLLDRAVALAGAAARAAGHQVDLVHDGAAARRQRGQQRLLAAQSPQPVDHGVGLPAIAVPEIAQGYDRRTVDAVARRTKGDVGHPDHVLERRRAAPAPVRCAHHDHAAERAHDTLLLEPDAAAQQAGDEAVVGPIWGHRPRSGSRQAARARSSRRARAGRP